MLKEFRTLVPYLKKYRFHYIFGLLSLVVTSGAQLLIPQFVRSAIDTIRQGSFELVGILTLMLQMVAVSLVIAVGRWGWRYFIHGASRKIEMHLRDRFFRHLLVMSPRFYGERKTGDLMAIATNDMQAIRMASGMAFVAATDGIFMTIAILVILFSQNARLAALTIIPLPFITFLIIFLGRLIGKLFRKVQEGFGRMSDQAQEVFSGVRVVKSFVKQSYFLRRFQDANETYQRRNMRLVRIWGLFFPMVTFLAGLTSLSLLFFGGRLLVVEGISPGEFVATLSYLEMLIWPVLGAGFTVNLIQRGSASLARLNGVFDSEPDIVGAEKTPDRPAGPEGAIGHIRVSALSFRYPVADRQDSASPEEADSRHQEAPLVLRDVDLDIPAGSTLGILGRTGSGKSTLVKTFPRLVDPPPGTVFVDGIDVRDYQLQDLRSLFGFVLQDTFLFSATLRENVSFAVDDIDEAELQRVADISTITRDMALFPDGWDTQVGERGITLSGGQKQRVAISRALAMNPQILVFDDALSAVDTETEEKILTELVNYRRGKTNIIISHRVSTLSVADQIVVLENGRIAQRGSHQELIGQEGFYREIHQLQQLEVQAEGAEQGDR